MGKLARGKNFSTIFVAPAFAHRRARWRAGFLAAPVMDRASDLHSAHPASATVSLPNDGPDPHTRGRRGHHKKWLAIPALVFCNLTRGSQP
jgi:hypothetical protein